MKCIVQYLYTGETRVPSTELEAFFRVAQKLKIFGLFEESETADNESNVSVPSYTVTYDLTSSESIGQNAASEPSIAKRKGNENQDEAKRVCLENNPKRPFGKMVQPSSALNQQAEQRNVTKTTTTKDGGATTAAVSSTMTQHDENLSNEPAQSGPSIGNSKGNLFESNSIPSTTMFIFQIIPF